MKNMCFRVSPLFAAFAASRTAFVQFPVADASNLTFWVYRLNAWKQLSPPRS